MDLFIFCCCMIFILFYFSLFLQSTQVRGTPLRLLHGQVLLGGLHLLQLLLPAETGLPAQLQWKQTFTGTTCF